MYIVQVLLGLAVLLYMLYAGFTVYFVMIGKKASLDIVGKLIWYHGVAWIVVLTLTAVFSLSLIMAMFIAKGLNIGL